MHDLHPNLGLPASGRRKAIYLTGGAITLGIGGLYILILLGLVPPTPTDVIAAWIILPVLFVPFFALVDNPGEHRSKVEKFSEFGFLWLLISGITQTVWELPWFVLDFTGLLHGVTADDHWAWIWWTYGGADTRYITSNPTIAGLEFMAGLSGPLELWGWYLYRFGKTVEQKIAGCWWALCICVGLTYLTGAFFVAEWHVDWVNIEQGVTGFWLKFIGLNLPWLIAPLVCIPAAIYELGHLYRLQGYHHALDQHGIPK